MQTWFEVIGQYGPQGGACIHLYVLTRDEERARKIFEERIIRDYSASMWSSIGQRNTDVFVRQK